MKISQAAATAPISPAAKCACGPLVEAHQRSKHHQPEQDSGYDPHERLLVVAPQPAYRRGGGGISAGGHPAADTGRRRVRGSSPPGWPGLQVVAAVTALVVLGRSGGPDDDDRARRVHGALPAHRPEQQPVESSETPVSPTTSISAPRDSFTRTWAACPSRTSLRTGIDARGDHLVDHGGERLAGHVGGVGGGGRLCSQACSSDTCHAWHDVEARSDALRVARRPPQRILRFLRGVHADDDPPVRRHSSPSGSLVTLFALFGMAYPPLPVRCWPPPWPGPGDRASDQPTRTGTELGH